MMWASQKKPSVDILVAAVESWLAANTHLAKPDQQALNDFAESWLAANIRQPKDGQDGKDAKEVTPSQIAEAVYNYMATHYTQPRDGLDGLNGFAPDHQWDGTKLRFQRPDGEWGEWVDLEGPRGKQGLTVGGGGGFISVPSQDGVTEVREGHGISVDNTDPKRPIVSATGGLSTKWVTLDGEPHILNFVSVGDDEFEMELTPL